jgi:hypothetical protein
VGWRNIIEKMHMTATLTKWYEEHGRHEIFAGNKKVPLGTTAHSLDLRDDLVTTEEQQDLVKLGIARNTREEKTRARDAQLAQELENKKMAQLYRQHILKEEPSAASPLIQLQVRKPKAPEPDPSVVSGGQ